MTTFAQDSKFVCIFQSALKYKSTYAAFGFSDETSLGDGAMWPRKRPRQQVETR